MLRQRRAASSVPGRPAGSQPGRVPKALRCRHESTRTPLSAPPLQGEKSPGRELRDWRSRRFRGDAITPQERADLVQRDRPDPQEDLLELVFAEIRQVASASATSYR